MLWACLHFPDLPLRAVYDDDELALPCAVVDGPRQRQSIAFANHAGQGGGATIGRTLAAARAVCANLQARPRDRAAERRLLLALAATAYRFSSQVGLAEPDALLLEIGASLRLFGGWPALERRLRRAFAALGHKPLLAVAPFAAAARVLAPLHDGFLADLPAPALSALGAVPVAQSGLGAAAISLLYNVGARRLRDVFALPRPELAKRIGPDALALLDRMRGGSHEALDPYEPPPRFEHRIELEQRVEAWPPLLFPLRRLCAELALFLAARDGGVQRCELKLEHEDLAPTRIAVELLAPQREARTLYELARSRLERAALPAAVCGIALVATDLPQFRPRHQDLFEPRRAQGLDWPELAERLRAHLGDDAVHRLAAAADHRPEKAWRFATGVREDPPERVAPPGSFPADAARKGVKARPESRRDETLSSPAGNERTTQARGSSPLPPAGEAAPPPASAPASQCSALPRAPEMGPVRVAPRIANDDPQTKAARPPLRPLWLLPRALPLRGPAPRVLAGPERIESGWWDGADARRDYYVVQTRDGQRAWAFLVPGTTDGWMLHGWFA